MLKGTFQNAPVLAFYPSSCYLSNCFIRPYVANDGTIYNCAQQHFQIEKAKFFSDFDTLKQIAAHTSPVWQKRLGREIKGFNQKDWDRIRTTVMHDVIYQKFLSDTYLTHLLLGDLTPQTIVAEASPRWEKFWGTARPLISPYVFDVNQWDGQNMVGKCIMEVYAELFDVK